MSNIAVVTGASQGIGEAIAGRLTEDGWRVFNLDRSAPDNTDNPSTWIETDLANPAAIATAFEIVAAEGPILGLVNNAGLGIMTELEETTIEDFDLTVDVNMKAPMLCTQAALPGMKEAGFGRIINISSRAMLGKTHRTAYAGTKGAIASMTRVWALELAQYGITVNGIAPGPIATDLFTRANPSDMPRTQEIIGTIPVGRLGAPTDIAHGVACFMDERASFINGQILFICGGISLARGGS